MAAVTAPSAQPTPVFEKAPRKPMRPRIPLVTFRGQSQTLGDWCRALGLEYDVVVMRFLRGWPLERAFSPEMFRKARK